MSKTMDYLKEVRAEAKHVTWPTRRQTMYFTITVLLVSLFVAYFLGAFDKLFSHGIEYIILNR